VDDDDAGGSIPIPESTVVVALVGGDDGMGSWGDIPLTVGETTGATAKTGAIVALSWEGDVGEATAGTGDGGGIAIGEDSVGTCDGAPETTTGEKVVELGDCVGIPVEKKIGGVAKIGVGVTGTGWDAVGTGAIVVGLAGGTAGAIGAGVVIVQPGAEQSPNITNATATSEPLALVQMYDESRPL
jgi:hypothetical protein